jgi:hypothetical protein
LNLAYSPKDFFHNPQSSGYGIDPTLWNESRSFSVVCFFEVFIKQKNLIETGFNKATVINYQSFNGVFTNYF